MATRRQVVGSAAVVITAASLATVMLLNTPDERDDLREQTVITATATRAPIVEPVPVLPDTEVPEPFEPTPVPLHLLETPSLSSLPPISKSARPSASSARISESREWPHVYCAPSHVGVAVYDGLSGLSIPCESSSPIAGRQYHGDSTGWFLIEDSPLTSPKLAVMAIAANNTEALAEPVKPRICRDKRSGGLIYMVVDHCPCIDPRTGRQCVDASGDPIYGEEIIQYMASCDGVTGLPHCNPPTNFTIPNPLCPAHLRVPVKFSGTIKRRGQTYWQYSAADRVLWIGQPFFVMNSGSAVQTSEAADARLDGEL